MVDIPRALSREGELKFRKLTVIRFVVATLIIGAAITVLQRDNRELSVIALYSLLGVSYFSSGSVYIAYRCGASFKSLLWMLTGIDLLILTMIIHHSGGSASYFSILYIIPVLVGGSYFQTIGGLTVASIATLVYVMYSLLELGGFISSPEWTWMPLRGGIYHPLLRCYLHVAVFVVAGVASGYISKRVLSKGKELADREREIRHMQLSTDSIVSNMNSGLIVTDMSGEILSVNPAALSILKLREDELKGLRVSEIDHCLEPLARELSLVLSTGVPRQRHELEIVRPDGEKLPLGISISLLTSEEGSTQGLIALFQDLTEVHRIRERIRQADKMAAIGELSAAIAHEIRAPLATICGSIEMLNGELELSGEHRTLMGLITKEAARLDNIITDFLEYARVRRPSFTSVDITRCVEEIVMLLEHSPVRRDTIAIRVRSGAKNLSICADDEQIRQVFMNLGMNACEAMREGGTLDITIDRVDARLGENDTCTECVRITFTNDGPPILDTVLPHIFEPFYTTKSSGTGLGLAIAARIVESHAGCIEVERTAAGTTEFSVVLPVYVTNGVRDKEIEAEQLVEV